MRVVGLLLMLIPLLSACAVSPPTRADEAATPAPGTFNVHMGGSSEFLVGTH